jgi:hypothetical protein
MPIYRSILNTEDQAKLERLKNLANSGAMGQSSNFALSIYASAQTYNRLSESQYDWVDKLIDRANNPEREKIEIGELQGVIALFDKAKQHLKSPGIVLNIGSDADGNLYLIQLRVAKDHHRVPGSINVSEYDDTKAWEDQLWYGRILRDGKFEIAPKVQHDEDAKANVEYAVAQLKEFANDPVGVATAHGKLTGRCCFCHMPLKDERSTAVGYGSTCAKNWGLAWGSRPAEFAAAPQVTNYEDGWVRTGNGEPGLSPEGGKPVQVPATRRYQPRRNIKVR